jgi:hypothetical protein
VLVAVFYVALAPPAAWILDDHDFIPTRAALDGLGAEWRLDLTAAIGAPGASSLWRPLVTSLWRVLQAALGADPEVLRAFNISLQALCALLVAACARAAGAPAGLAAGVGAAWGLHGAGVDTVAWGVGGFDLTSTALALGATTLLARPAAAADGHVSTALRTAAAALAALGAVASKESGLILGVILPLLFGFRGLGAAVAVAMFWGLHQSVTGAAPLAASPSAAALVSAWLQGFGWILAPPATGLLAVLRPDDVLAIGRGVATLLAVVGLGWIGAREASRSAGPAHVSAIHRRTLAALAVAVLAGAPAAFAVATTQVAPTRYAHLPAALTLALLAPALAALPSRARWALGLGWFGLHLPWSAGRLQDWRDEVSLLRAELVLAPENPLPRAWIERARAAECDRVDFRAWAAAASAGAGLPFLAEERYVLAQAAFLCGRPDIAAAEVTGYLEHHPGAPANAWCLLADSLDALGHEGDAEAAARRCAG